MSCNLLRRDQGEVRTDRTTHTKEGLVPGAGTLQSMPCYIMLCCPMFCYVVFSCNMLCHVMLNYQLVFDRFLFVATIDIMRDLFLNLVNYMLCT